jgi:DNA-binding transcriptional LysR family regulator
MEELLGVELVDRRRKPAQPSAALLDQQNRIRELAGELRALVADLKREGRQTQNRVVIASQHAITTSTAPAIVKRLTDTTDVSIRLRSVNRDECIALLLTKQADITLTYRSPNERALAGEDYIEVLALGEEDFIPVFAAAGANKLTEDFRQGVLPMIAYPSNVFLGSILNDNLLPPIRAQTVIRSVAETALTLAALQLAKAGIGLAWVPKSLALGDLADGNLVDLSAKFPSTKLDLVASRLVGHKSAVEAFVWKTISMEFGFSSDG